ncbi:MAG: hypothetical protein DMF49_07080 [Acidobacteria bacterium]|nr:MAG: hypothetical protein DMF49_07080 [Acidobacteriota bacterium]
MRSRPGRSEAAAAAIILAITAAVLLLPLAVRGPVYYRDLSQNLLPVRLLAASLRAAGAPLTWDPYLGGGVPLAENPNTLLWHPAWLLDLVLPPEEAIKAAIALHLSVAAGFMAAFLRRRGGSPSAAAAGAAVFAFGGPVLSLATLPNLLTAAAWIPPTLYFLDRARAGNTWALPAAVACGAASLMPADPAGALALAAGAWLAATPPSTGAGVRGAAGLAANGWAGGSAAASSSSRIRLRLVVFFLLLSAAAAGAAVFAFGGPVLSLATLPNLLTAAAWIPPTLYFLDRARAGNTWALPAAVACGAASLMPADPAGALALAAGAWLAATPPSTGAGVRGAAGLAANGWAGGSAAASSSSRIRLRLVVFFLLLSAAAALPQLLPAWQIVRRSERGLGFPVAEAVKWSLSPARLPELVVPGWLGDPTRLSAGHYWGAAWLETGLPFLLTIYVGIPALALAVSAGAGGRRFQSERLSGLVLAAGGLTLSFGRHLPGYTTLVDVLPGAGFFRYPEKFLVPAALGFSILVAVGLERVSGSGEDSHVALRRRRRYGLVLAGIGLAIGLAAGVGGPSRPLNLSAEALLGRVLNEQAASRLRRSAFHASAASTIAGLLLLLRSGIGGRRRQRGAAEAGEHIPAEAPPRLSLAVLVCADLALAAIGPPAGMSLPWGLRFNPIAPELLRGRPPKAVLPPAEGSSETWRTFRGERPEGFMIRQRDDSIASGFRWDRLTLARSWPAAFASPTAYDRPTDRLLPVEVARAAEIAHSGTLEQRLRLWSLDSVRFITSYGPLDHSDLALVARLDGASRPPLLRYENRAALPRVRLVQRSVRAGGPADALRLSLSPEIDPRTTVVIDAGPENEADLGAASERAESGEEGPGQRASLMDEASLVSPGDPPDHLLVRTHSARSGWLVLAENFDPDWRAAVDGRPAPVYRAYGFLRALPLPAGAHEVSLEYRPRSLLAGTCALVLAAVLSLVAAIGLPHASGRGRHEGRSFT